MPEPLLNLHDVHIQHAGAAAKACEAISFTVDAGERVALVGRSGAGKTTLLRAVNASIPVSAGQITFAGRPANPIARSHLRDLRRRIAMVPQKHDLIDGLRVYHNVMAGALGRWSDAHALRFLVWPRASELAEAEDALRRVGLADKLRSRAGALSGGQQQRVAIARALVQRPLLLLADEPVASLDPTTAQQVLELLCRLAETEKMALICTLHQPDLAQRYFPRRLTMEAGRLVDDTHAAGDRAPAARSRAGAAAPTYRLAGARE